MVSNINSFNRTPEQTDSTTENSPALISGGMGAREWGMTASVIAGVVGATMLGKCAQNTVGATLGATLLSTGVSGGFYVCTKKEDQLNWKTLAKQFGSSALSNMISGSIALFGGRESDVGRILVHTCGIGAGSIVSKAVTQFVEKKEMPQPKEVVKQLVQDGSKGFASSLASLLSERLLRAVMTEKGEFLFDFWLRVLQEGTKGATGTAAGVVVKNAWERKPLGKELTQQALLGGCLGGGVGAASFYYSTQDLNSELNQRGKEFLELDAKLNKSHRWLMHRDFTEEECKMVLDKGFMSSLKSKIDSQPAGTSLGQVYLSGRSLLDWLEASSHAKIIENGFTTIERAFHAFADLFVQPPTFVTPPDIESYEAHNILSQAIQPPNPISYFNCGMDELIPHVVLVQGIMEDKYEYYFSQIKDETVLAQEWEKCVSTSDKSLYCLKGVITPDGVIGHHLKLGKREFEGNLEGRPHLHWSWNQLVQPHNAGTWEDARIAVLEPLSAFENDIYYRPFSVAPYDTLTFNSHRLSEKSVLLVPEFILSEAQAYLPAFRDRIVPFKGTLRSAVVDTLETHYPDIWHICDERGNLIGKEAKHSAAGYSDLTCLKTKDGQVIILLRKEGLNETEDEEGLKEIPDHSSTAFKEYHKSKRFIGLHAHAATVWIEDGKYFKTLTNFKKNHMSIKGDPSFAGEIRDVHGLASLGILKALKLYHRLLKFDQKTGAIEVANYIINEAAYADLVSLFYQMNPGSKFDLSILDLKLIFDSNSIYLLNLLENIQKNIESNDPHQKQEAMKFFISELNQDSSQHESTIVSYCTILKKSLVDIQKAKREALRLTSIEKEKINDGKLDEKIPLCLLVAKDEWEKIVIPNSIEFDLGKNWPYGSQLDKYINKMLRTLPSERIQLQQLYRQLSSYTHREINSLEKQKEQYRINIICSTIQWILQEKAYLETRKNYHSSILANKLSKQIGFLAEYGLQAEDFTLNIGDCLFDNIVAQLPNNTITPSQLRKDIVQYMQKHSDKYGEKPDYNDNHLRVGDGAESVFFENWEQYLACMSKPLVWGTELEINALAFHLDCPIILLTVDMPLKIYNHDGKNDPLFLHYLHLNHFEACVPFKGLTINDVYNAIKSKSHYF